MNATPEQPGLHQSRYAKARRAPANSERISQTEPPSLRSFEPRARLPRLNPAGNTDRVEKYR
jgi:hypothetical protein